MPGPGVGVMVGVAVMKGVRVGKGVSEGRSVAVGTYTVPLVSAGCGDVACRITST